MQPQYQPFQNNPQQPLLQTKLVKWVITLIVLLGLIFVGWQIYLSTTLHVVKTDPGLGSIGAISPWVKIYFNEPINKDGLSVQTDSNMTSFSLNDKVITVNLNQHLTVGQKYTIVIKNASSSSGKTLQNKQLTFTAKNIAFDKLSKEQQQAIVSKQDQYPYSVTSIDYSGFDSLTARGISMDQVETLKSNLFSYSVQSGKNYKKMSIQTSSLVITPHDPNGSNPFDYANFDITLDSTPFKVKLSYFGLSGASVLMTDATGTVVYDSVNDHD